ncbi:hypothetical protein HYH03_009568 [Edaphochlamys debaryana]|uniref:ubiquitinyl hydrolase 1 n=1 Tax=Edaphochlamys debaryana TaxID=47281 RepID=A0A836BXJ8_9CHLO|nr:hypothetical protein HYH03_009568 [Edaphochlamys debaryana]|eukprot:KAG2492072.1 hypothetical protein HYH03_009568 [Edaphochlamys debaryana]
MAAVDQDGNAPHADGALLQSIFAFPTAPPSQLQSQEGIRGIVQLLNCFVRTLQQERGQPTTARTLWPGLEPADLEALAVTAVAAGNSQTVTWLPDFGAALMALHPGPDVIQPRPGTLALHLVCLDSWEFWAHSSPSGVHHTAVSSAHTLLACGDIPAEDHARLVQLVHTLTSKALKKRKEGEKGFQRTPAFIRSVIEAALTTLQGGAHASGDITSRGGFTDVGQHTGGDAVRDTCWPLVQSVLKVLLACAPGCAPAGPPEILFRCALAHLELWLLRGQLRRLTPETAGPEAVTNAMHMLECAAGKAAALADEGHDVSALEAACASARACIEEAVAQRVLRQAQGVELPDEGSPGLTGRAAPPSGTLPSRLEPRTEEGGLEAMRQRAAANLGSVPLLPSGSAFSDVLNLLRSQRQWTSPADDVQYQLVLRSVEGELFSRAAVGFSASSNRLSGAEVAALEAMVDTYRLTLQRFLDTPAVKSAAAEGALLRAELHSRELLVVWVAYCLIHAAADQEYGIVQQYGVALSYKDLRHLALSDRAAVDAALAVAAYLQRRTVPGRELFSLRDGGTASFQLAREFAASCPRLQRLWQQEEADAEARRDQHWAEVERKQAEAQQLRHELSQLQVEAASLQSTLEEVLSSYNAGGRYASSYFDVRSARNAVSRNKHSQTSKQREIQQAEKAPPAVIQPLPQASSAALVWVFFLHMPPLFRSLSRASFLAQQMLLPRPLICPDLRELRAAVAVDKPKTSLASHYNSYRAVQQYLRHPTQTVSGADGSVQLWSTSSAPDTHAVGPKHVDRFTDPSDGVWHPDGLLPCMGWPGSGAAADQQLGLSGYFNPFAPVPAAAVEDIFTATLPAGAKDLQWALHTPEEPSADRGNIAVARQDLRPSWLDKPAFLAFGSLRAFPLRQLWRLCVALRERTLPLGHPAVHVLVRQLLYHIGTLTDGASPEPLWRTGWDEEPNGVLPTLCGELAALAEQMDPSPREHEAVMLLGPVSAYVASFYPPCLAVARRFAAMTSRYADELEVEIAQNSGDARLSATLQAKQCRWRAMSLLCYDSDALAEAGDAAAMARLMVLVNHGRVFLPDPALLAQGEALQLRTHNVIARRIAFLVQAAKQHPGILTAAVGAVLRGRDLSGLHWASWAQLPDSQASYEAVGPDGRLYTLNLLDGTVLFDGWPPSRLPKEVTQHPQYVRTFGGWSFEVAGGAKAGAASTRQSLRPVNGRLYEFTSGQGIRSLVVTEVDVEREVRLELLDVGEGHGCGEWGKQLPPRLRELYSHWLCRERGVIVLRPRNFQEHFVHFIMECRSFTRGADSSSGPVLYDCRRVPLHLQRLHWLDLLSDHRVELTDQLVLLSGCGVRDTVLAKIEDTRFIHCYQPASSSQQDGVRPRLLFELPRYGLEFELRSGGELASRDYPGYRLRRRQLLVDTGSYAGYGSDRVSCTLPEFHQYLVLERSPAVRQLPVGAQRTDKLVVMPAGSVRRSGGQVALVTKSGSGARLKAHCYEVHGRFGHLRASAVAPRLQLAALYAATGTLLPEPASRATGGQTAMNLLRQCWGTRPLTAEELQHLDSVRHLGGQLTPGLRPLVAELAAAASQLSHLYPPQLQPGTQATTADGVTPRDACIAFEQYSARARKGWAGLNLRNRLSRSEERRVLGVSWRMPADFEWRRRGLYQPVTAPVGFPVKEGYVVETEALLASLVKPLAKGAGSGKGARPAYPLSPTGDSHRTPLEVAMHQELEESWRQHHALTAPEHMRLERGQLLPTLQRVKAEVYERRAAAEAFLLRHASAVPEDVGCHGAAFRLFRLSGAAPSAGPLDLVVAAWRPEVLRQYNPFLSDQAVAGLREGVLTWLALCVLEDRLGRLEALAEAGEEYRVQLVQELLVRRVWDVRAHPQWLVFEVEGRLQIRPQQYAVAAHLMDPANAGAIAQLNMGEGKTRVILPMLALHWADGSRVVRLNFLSTLLDEAYGHLHAHLTASVLGRKLFTLPFHRDVELTEARVHAMASAIRHCQQDGGLVLVAPEHRLSLLLKRTEMGSKAQAGEEEDREAAARCCSALDELAALPYMDVLDESDELLHHRFQLIYACGAPTGLPAVTERAGAVQAVLSSLSRLAASGRLPLPEGAAVLEAPSAASAQPGAQLGSQSCAPPPGSFCGLRLLPGEALSDRALQRLRHSLLQELAASPPLELHWLKEHPRKARILACIFLASLAAEELLGPDVTGTGEGQITPDRLSQVLALRGLLGCGLLEHGLQKRHRVDYGVDRSTAQRPAQPPGARGRTHMAVPFRAAHVPSERSEFAQPDVGLLLTHVSADELQAALAKLLAMGPSAQQYVYEERWLPLARDRIEDEHLPLLDSAAKLDPSNPTQLQLLHAYFSHNTAAVGFWLTYCVLPSETRQFPQRLAASAWHLAGRGAGGVVGFSGTNDNHRLLPLQVHKAEPEEPSLAATNGKMLHVILEHSLGFTTLPAESGGLPAWQALLDTALELQRWGVELSALIDCGALLAGTSNRSAAAYLLSRLDRGRYRGVTYFDEGQRSWVVEDRQGRRAPRHASPIPEADTFVLFDDARCRGADLKLRLGAVGLLTLGPGSTKDKVMQAAGRLRQLGRGQKLWLAAAPDVAAKIRSGSGAAAVAALDARPCRSAAEAVLRWVMANTVDATLAGVQAWADQGLSFAASGGVPQPADELLELADFYGGSKGNVPVARAVEALAAAKQQGGAQAGRVPPVGPGGVQQYVTQIMERSTEYGEGHMVVAGGRADEECERQLEQEEEEEEEVEREVPRVTPRSETNWSLSIALAGSITALSPASLAAAAGVAILPLPSAVQQNLAPASLRGIPWSTKVYATDNFLLTASSRPSPLNEYLRPLDALLLFPGSAEALLISEREADRLLGALWQLRRRAAASRGGAPLLLSLCYLRDAWASGAVPRLAVSLDTGATLAGSGTGLGATGAAPASLDARALVSMQLFNGEASYARGAARREVRALMVGRREEAEALVGMRGKGVALPKSDLERAVEGAREDG